MQPMTMRAAFSHQRQSAAISGHQRPSTAIGEDLT
jgi:hypothetical protein